MEAPTRPGAVTRLMSGCSSGNIRVFRMAEPLPGSPYRDISDHPRGLPERWPVRSHDDQPDPGDVAGGVLLGGSGSTRNILPTGDQ
jgi:hypothetical protein